MGCSWEKEATWQTCMVSKKSPTFSSVDSPKPALHVVRSRLGSRHCRAELPSSNHSCSTLQNLLEMEVLLGKSFQRLQAAPSGQWGQRHPWPRPHQDQQVILNYTQLQQLQEKTKWTKMVELNNEGMQRTADLLGVYMKRKKREIKRITIHCGVCCVGELSWAVVSPNGHLEYF